VCGWEGRWGWEHGRMDCTPPALMHPDMAVGAVQVGAWGVGTRADAGAWLQRGRVAAVMSRFARRR
jgi:hypothetical protein